MHGRILDGFSKGFKPPEARVPGHFRLIRHDEAAFWENELFRFPPDYEPCLALIAQRSPPVPQAVRELLIDRYCLQGLKSTIRESTPDKDCLVRLYLGNRRQHFGTSQFESFCLRNEKLYADQIEQLGLDIALYTRLVAQTLAACTGSRRSMRTILDSSSCLQRPTTMSRTSVATVLAIIVCGV